MSAWTDYVKAHYQKVAHLPIKERFKALSEMRKGGAEPKPKAGKKGKKDVKAGMLVAGALYDPKHSFISDIFKM